MTVQENKGDVIRGLERPIDKKGKGIVETVEAIRCEEDLLNSNAKKGRNHVGPLYGGLMEIEKLLNT